MNPAAIYIDPVSSDDAISLKILKHYPDVPVTDAIPTNPNSLVLTRKPGRFVRPCPGTKKYLCCGYRILDFVQGCNLGCNYCVLQAYLDYPGLVIYTNWEQIWEELEAHLSASKGFVRLGSGEFTDSLLLDNLLDFSGFIIPRITRFDNVILELKTKTANIDNLKNLPHRKKVIVSWSLNARQIIEKEEAFSSPLQERLNAAHRCREWGYRLGFHFDPLIYHPNWEDSYREVVGRLFAVIRPENIAWISMGCLRFAPDVPKQIEKSHPESKIIRQEFIPGDDGKLRYFKPLRIKIYSHLLKMIRSFAPDVTVYLCMESPSVWRQVFGFAPSPVQFKRMLDESAAK